MKLNCYIYGAFRAEYDTESEEVEATFPDWQEPFFYFTKFTYEFLSDLMGYDEISFPFRFYGEDKDKAAELGIICSCHLEDDEDED